MNHQQKITQFLGKFFDVEKVGTEDNIFELGLVSSLFAMQLVSFLEKEFNIVIDNDELDLENFKDIKSINGFVSSKLD